MPDAAQVIVRHFPTAYAINLLEIGWAGGDLFYGHYFIVVATLTGVFGLLSIKFFRYE
jgi:hypothetical protein